MRRVADGPVCEVAEEPRLDRMPALALTDTWPWWPSVILNAIAAFEATCPLTRWYIGASWT